MAACVQGAAGSGHDKQPAGPANSTSSCRTHHVHISHTGGSAEGAVEMDPTKRYIRYPILLGRGACKRVYKAFDLEEGIEVAWNKAELSAHGMDPEQQERLFAEIRVLKTLKHRNIITCYDWWHDAPSQTINFITEYFTSGTLRQYRKRHLRHISDTAFQRWAFQILEGLLYLHAHSPPIVHRDLKCDNILVNGTSGQVKIADLGLASCQRGMSVVGTPEFMAPEMYDEVYDEKVDIYAFGMCMLELATLEYPYSECRSIPAIFMRVSKGIPPAALVKVQSDELRELITTCINHDPKQRPGALQLLKHAFFADLAERHLGSPTYGGSSGSKHSGFAPPFGSCGNLMALSHGSITQHMCSHAKEAPHHSTGSVQGDGSRESSSSSGGSSGGDASASASGASSREQSSGGAAAAAAGPGTSKQDEGVNSSRQCSMCGQAETKKAGVHAAACTSGTAARVAAAAGEPATSHTVAHKAARFADSSECAQCPSASDKHQRSTHHAHARSSSGSSGDGGGGSSNAGGGAATAAAACGARAMGRAAAAAGGVRGTTVCVAKIGRSDNTQDDEDSDDEVLVSLEDVLVPHPQDFMDAQALGLTTQLKHAGSGCTIMSGPGYTLTEGLGGLLDHMASESDLGLSPCLLSRFASNAAALQQQQQQQHSQHQVGQCVEQDAGVSQQQQEHQQQEHQQQEHQQQQQHEQQSQQQQEEQQQQRQQQTAGDGGRASSSSSSGDARPCSRPHSRLGSTSGPGPSILQHAGMGHSSSAGAHSSSSNTPARASCSSSGGASPHLRPASASAAATLPAAAAGSTPGSSSTAATAAAAAVSAAQLLRSISTISSSKGVLTGAQATGALAAAGLLQVSPGCYVPTPHLLEKLLSKAATPRGHTPPPPAVAGSTAVLLPLPEAAAAAAAAAALTPLPEGAAAYSPEAENAVASTLESAAAAGLGPGMAQQHSSNSSHSSDGSSSSFRDAAEGACAPAAQALPAADGIAQQLQAAGDIATQAGLGSSSILPHVVSGRHVINSSSSHIRATADAAPEVAAALAAAEAAETATPIAVAAAGVASSSAAASPERAAAGAAAGGYGRILVRRRFVKNLQQQPANFKRWNTL